MKKLSKVKYYNNYLILFILSIELIQVISEKQNKQFILKNTLECHQLPLTNCFFNKNGDKFITGSYDQTCIIWDTKTGKMKQKLKGHTNVVYTISFNLPYDDKVGNGSFDNTVKLWNVNDDQCLSTFKGHSG